MNAEAIAATEPLKILGLVPRARVFSIGDLANLGCHELGPTQVLCFSDCPVA